MTIRRFATAALLLLGSVSLTRAEVLFEQTSVAIGNPASNSVAVFSALTDAEIEESQVWDNFSLSSSATVTGLTWKGAFGGEFNPDDTFRGESDFTIRFFADAGGTPDVSSTLFEFDLDGGLAGINNGSDVRKQIVPNERQAQNGILTNYEADLAPFDLTAGSYWLSIQADQTLPSLIEVHDDPKWAWAFAVGGDDGIDGLFSYDEAFGDTVKPGVKFNSIDAAFAILGDFDTTGVFGDFDFSGVLDVPDIDLLAGAIRGGDVDSKWDVDKDGSVTDADHAFWLSDLANRLPGDAALDADVDFADFLKHSAAFGKGGGWAEGNFDTDTDVDFADFLKLSGNFGRTTAGSAAQSVPEPSAGVLGVLALVALGMIRRRR